MFQRNSRKRAQAQTEAIKYIIATIIVGVILLFGVRGIMKLNETQCKIGMATLESDLTKSVRVMESQFGSRKEFSTQVPCGADLAFALDLSKNTQLAESFRDMPVIQDYIESDSDHNLFILKDGNIINSFALGTLDISYPYYECFRVSGGKLKLLTEGKRKSIGISQSSNHLDCTLDKPYSLELSPDDNARLKDEIRIACVESGKQCDLSERNDIIFTNRTFIDEDGITKVVVDVSSTEELSAFDYYEHIPKCVADGLIRIFDGDTELGNLQLSNGIIETRSLIGSSFEFEVIKPDPEMMWHFSGGNFERKKIEYWIEALTEELENKCKREFQGLVADIVLGNDACQSADAFTASYNTFAEGGTDNCGQICSDAGICATDELCDSDSDCSSPFGCDTGSTPSVCN